jgi:hypothetical protein
MAPRPARAGPGARGGGDGEKWGGGRDGGERIVGGVHRRRGTQGSSCFTARAGRRRGLRSSAGLTGGPKGRARRWMEELI